ncbi:MAG: serine hydrolase domain-containing protein, partial [Candidatus Thiodiazotropha endolucinida]
IRQSLLLPMSMPSSYIAPGLIADRMTAKGYYQNKEKPVVLMRDLPAGALNSNVRDLARFTQMVFAEGWSGSQQILKSETLDEMLRYQDGDAPFDLDSKVGLAWFLDDSFGEAAGLVAGHDGATFLFSSSLMVLPKHKLAVIVLSNTASVGEAIVEIAQESLKRALVAKTGIAVADKSELSDEVFPARSEDLQMLPGYYSTQLGTVHIKPAGDRFKVDIDGEKLDLVLREDGRYHLQFKLLGLIPLGLGRLKGLGFTGEQIAGRNVLIGHHNGHRFVAGERISPTLLPEVWQNRLGKYEVTNLENERILDHAELKFEDGIFLLALTLRLPHLPDKKVSETIALTVKTDDEAIIHGLGRGRGGTIRAVQQKGEELLNFSGFYFKRIH